MIVTGLVRKSSATDFFLEMEPPQSLLENGFMKMMVIPIPRTMARLGLLMVMAFALAIPATAHAHARLERSTPKDKSKLAEAPKQIDLWFSELLDNNPKATPRWMRKIKRICLSI